MSNNGNFEMFNSLMGITPEEVERVTRDGIRLVRAKRIRPNLFQEPEPPRSNELKRFQSENSFLTSERTETPHFRKRFHFHSDNKNLQFPPENIEQRCRRSLVKLKSPSRFKGSKGPKSRINIPSIRTALLNPTTQGRHPNVPSFKSADPPFDYKVIQVAPNGSTCSLNHCETLGNEGFKEVEDPKEMINDAGGDQPQDAGNTDKSKSGRESGGKEGYASGTGNHGRVHGSKGRSNGRGVSGNGGGKDDDSDRKRRNWQAKSENVEDDDTTSIETSTTNSLTSIVQKPHLASKNVSEMAKSQNSQFKTERKMTKPKAVYDERDKHGHRQLVFNYDALPSWTKHFFEKQGNTETGLVKRKMGTQFKKPSRKAKKNQKQSLEHPTQPLLKSLKSQQIGQPRSVSISSETESKLDEDGSQNQNGIKTDDEKYWVDYDADGFSEWTNNKTTGKPSVSSKRSTGDRSVNFKRSSSHISLRSLTISSITSSRGSLDDNKSLAPPLAQSHVYLEPLTRSGNSKSSKQRMKVRSPLGTPFLNMRHKSKKSRRKRGPNKTLKRVATASEYFSDGDISSDSDLDASDTPSGEDERDAEWLLGEYSDEGVTPKIHHSQVMLGSKELTQGIDSKEASDKLMIHLMPLYTMMRFTGRLPITVQKKNKRPQNFLFDKNSWEYRAFIISSLILTLSFTAIVLNFITILRIKSPKTLYENILSAELNKYWIEIVVTLVPLYFICTWSISVLFEGGIHFGDYLTRWNLSTFALRYDVTYGLKSTILIYQIGLVIYVLLVVILFFFGGEAIPFVRESCGFIALLATQALFTELRLSPYYFLLQYLGLLFHLYVVLSGGFLLITIILYSISLKNAAQRFNLRLAFALRKVALPENGVMTMRVSRIIPYDKLWGEHVIITSMSRHTGRVFAVAFNAFYITKMIEMVVTAYSIWEPFNEGTVPSLNDTFLPLSSNTSRLDARVIPVRADELPLVKVSKSIYFFLNCVISFFVLTEVLHEAGAAIMGGFGYVRRHGMILCRSLNERRFIISMENSGAPNADYFIKAWLPINRQFVLMFLGFTISFFILLVQCNPGRLEIDSHIICDHVGECIRIKVPRYYDFNRGTPVFVSTITKPTTTTTVKPTMPPKQPRTTITPKPNSFVLTPCDTMGLLPIKINSFAYPCKRSSSINYIPMFFKNSDNYFDPVAPDCDTKVVNTSEPLYNCFGELIPNVIQDDCQIPMLPTIDEKGTRIEAEIELVPLKHNANPTEMLCCFKYAQLEHQIETCNLGDSSLLASKCKPTQSEERSIYQELMQREIAVQDISNPRQNLTGWAQWVECICQSVTGVEKGFSYCRPLFQDYPPCQDQMFNKVPHSNEDFNPSTCSWTDFENLEKGLKMQIIYKRDKYLRYYPVISSGVCGTQIYEETTSLAPIRNGVEFETTDCYGGLWTQDTVNNIGMDDCGNLKLVDNPNLGNFEVKLEYKAPNEIFCCFTWSSRASLKCNLEPSTMSHKCGNKSKSPERQEGEALFWEEFDKNNGSFLPTKLNKYKKCICQGIGGLPSYNCENVKRTPNCDESQEAFKESFATQCPGEQTYIIGYYEERDTSVVKQHQDCSVSGGNSLDSFMGEPGAGFVISDCYNNVVNATDFLDDCGNFRVQTPDSNNIKQWPTIKSIVIGNATKGKRACCWHYVGFDKEVETCNLRQVNMDHFEDICAVRTSTRPETVADCSNVHNVNGLNRVYHYMCASTTKYVGGKKVCNPSATIP